MILFNGFEDTTFLFNLKSVSSYNSENFPFLFLFNLTVECGYLNVNVKLTELLDEVLVLCLLMSEIVLAYTAVV